MTGLVVALLALRRERHMTHDKMKIDHDISFVKHRRGHAEKLFVVNHDVFILEHVEILGEHGDKVDVETVLGGRRQHAETSRLATIGDETSRIFEKMFIPKVKIYNMK